MEQISTLNVDAFRIEGLVLTTTNLQERRAPIIPNLWQQFNRHHCFETIPDKIDLTRIYALYTNYTNRGDGYYTLCLGAKIAKTTRVQPPFSSYHVPASPYAVFKIPGSIEHVHKVRQDFWNVVHTSDLHRSFTGDFEVYDLENDEVYLYVSVSNPLKNKASEPDELLSHV